MATADAVEAVQKQAAAWVHAELGTLKAMLSRGDDERGGAAAIRAAMAELDAVTQPP